MTLKCFKTKTDGSAYLFDKKELEFSLSSLVLYLITRGTEKSLCSGLTQVYPNVLYSHVLLKKPLATKHP